MVNGIDRNMTEMPGLGMNSGVADELNSLSIQDIQNQSFLNYKIPPKLLKFMNMDNIADSLNEEQLGDIASVVYDSYEVDKESRSEWNELMKDSFELVEPNGQSKNTPWENASNVKYPLITGSCIHFNSAIISEVIKNDKVVEARLMAPDDDLHQKSNRAERISDHMSYQLLGQSDNWVRDTDKMMMTLPMVGVCYRKSFFNSIKGMPDTEMCLPSKVIVNDNIKSLESAQRVTHRLSMTTNEIVENMKKGLFLKYPIDDLQGPSYSTNDEDNGENQSVPSFSVNEKINDNFYDTTHEILEQHRYLDLDGDGYQEPYIVTVHKDSNKVLRIVARYDQGTFEFDEEGNFVKINPIHYFTDFHFLPSPKGTFHSYGFGSLLYNVNETINSILNQLIDAGVLSNRQCGFIGKDLRAPKGDLDFRPGEWKQVISAPGTTIAQNVYPLPIKEPSQTLYSLLIFLIDSATKITSVGDVMAGEMPPPNTPAATVMAVVEQGQKTYSAILYRVYEALKKEFKKLYEINRKYLKEEEYFPLADSVGMVSIQDYMQPNYGIFPVADPKLSSSIQRNMQAQALLQLDRYPQINMDNVLRNYLDVLKVKNPDMYLKQVDPNAPPPMELQLADAQKRNIEMDTACKLIDRELEAWSNAIDETKVKSQSAYYGGQLAGDKVESIAKLTALEREATQEEIQRAAVEEEVLTKETQLQDVPVDVHQRLSSLEDLVGQTLSGLVGQQGAAQMPPGAAEVAQGVSPEGFQQEGAV
jgi:chaperonin GroES